MLQEQIPTQEYQQQHGAEVQGDFHDTTTQLGVEAVKKFLMENKDNQKALDAFAEPLRVPSTDAETPGTEHIGELLSVVDAASEAGWGDLAEANRAVEDAAKFGAARPANSRQ